MEVKLFVVSHKKFKCPQNNIYKAILVGNKDFEFPDSFRDDTNINIAHKNSNYCELTALYWIWKNISSDILGICHYRRYFSKSKCSKEEKFFLNEEDILGAFKEYDIIMPEPNRWSVSVSEMYYNYGEGKKKDLDLLREIIKETEIQYLDDFDKIMSSNSASYRNMFITKQNLFNEYCEWLFSILENLEKRVDLTGYTKEEARIYGYLSEILLNVWVRHHNLKIKYYPIMLTDVSSVKNIKMRIRNNPNINKLLDRIGI